MEMSEQIRAPATLTLWKDSPVPTA